MSGHSKWSTIKRKKEARDKARGNVFTKMANAISVAVKKGGSGDPDVNFSLRLAMDKAKAVNMPNENIKRAIDRGLGKTEEGKLDEIVFEGYGPQGAAVIVECVTDNRNRTVSELKVAFDKGGGNLAEPGSVMYRFERVGLVEYDGNINDELYLDLIDKGLIEMDQDDKAGVVYIEAEKLSEVVDILEKSGLESVSGEVVYRSKLKTDDKMTPKLESFIEILKDIDEVQEVYTNVKEV